MIAANRIGTETVTPDSENQQQSSSLTFYGSSFIADNTGALVECADRTSDTVLLHTFDSTSCATCASAGAFSATGGRRCTAG